MAVLSCFEWLGLLFHRQPLPSSHDGRDLFDTLPDDVVVDILCRLSVDQVLQCRAVCKRWCSLTATRHFMRYHGSKGSTTSGILLHSLALGNDLLYLYRLPKTAEWKEMHRLTRFSVTRRHYRPKLLASCNGLLVLEASESPAVHFICNPVTHEQVILRDLHGMLGFFYNSLTRKYGFLCTRMAADSAFLFYIINCNRTTSRVIGTFQYAPCTDYVPALNLDGRLYWVARSWTPCAFCIIVFEMDTEKLSFMPHPGVSCQGVPQHVEMYMLEMEGRLCFAHFSRIRKSIKIWVLEDYGNWSWAERFNVNLYTIEWILWQYFCDSVIVQYPCCWIQPLGIQDQELILAWNQMGLIKYHLQRGRLSRVGGWDLCGIIPYSCNSLYTATSSRMTFASLRDLQ